MKNILLFMVLGVSLLGLNAQHIYENKTFSPLIKTVILEQNQQSMSDPVLYLGENKKLLLSFDELVEDTKRYEYTILHCNSDWTPSQMEQSLYLNGYEVQKIEGYANSFNTIQRYVHYYQTIPSNDMEITKSGNYIIKVFQEDNPDKVILTQRFYVVEDKANILGEITAARDAALYNTCQELSVKIEGKDGYFFQNPQTYMNVVCMQNNREDTRRSLKLRATAGASMDYSFDKSNIFAGGNEFRRFDFTSLRFRSQYVRGFDFIDGENQVFLFDEKVKKSFVYSSEKDLNGKFYIRNDYHQDNATCSDYAWVHFTLPMPISLQENFYIVGQMTSWRMSEQNKMQYYNGAYHLSLYLKQGVYNYLILNVPSDNIGNTSSIEGNHSQCNNSYQIFVYYRNFSDDYDELVGYSNIQYR